MSMNRRRGGAEEADADAEAEAEADLDMPRAVKGEGMSVGRRDASEAARRREGGRNRRRRRGRARRAIELRTNAARIRSADVRVNATRGAAPDDDDLAASDE